MIKFDENLLTYKYINVLKVANSGIITHIDENNIEHKLKCPTYLIQEFKRKAHKSNFRKGKKSCVLFYNNYPVNIDTPTSLFFNISQEINYISNWVSKFEKGIEDLKQKIIENFSENFEKYIDGKFIYFLKKKTEEEIEKTTEIEPAYKKITKSSEDGFYTANVKSFNIKGIGSELNIYAKKIILYHIKNTETQEYITAISPTVSGGIKYKDIDTNKINFDKIDDLFYVNLNFILHSTKVVGETKGYESISFLDLEETLIEMNTVNLFSFPEYIRNIKTIKQTFKECLAWILGLTYREDKIENIIKYRNILSGIFEAFLVKKDYVDNTIKSNISVDKVELRSMDYLKEKYLNLDNESKTKILINEDLSRKFLI